MPIMNEAIPKEDWERMEKGLPPIKRQSPPRPEPEKPKLEDEISLKNVNFKRLLSVKRDNKRNKEMVLFIGYSVRMEVKKGAGIETLGGWVPEAEWMEFIRANRGKVNMEALGV